MNIFAKDALATAKKNADTAENYSRTAAKRLESEQANLAAAQKVTADFDNVVKTADHESADAFDKLIAERTRLRAKLEPLEFRVGVARDSLAAAETKAAEARVAAWELELSMLRTLVEAEDQAAYGTMYAARRKLRKHISIVNDHVELASELDAKIREARGEPPRFGGFGTVGSSWAGLLPNQDALLQAAAGIVASKDYEDPAAHAQRTSEELESISRR